MFSTNSKRIEKFFGLKSLYEANKIVFIKQVQDQAKILKKEVDLNFAEEKWSLLSLKERQNGNTFDDIIYDDDNFFDMKLHKELLEINKRKGHSLLSYREKVDEVHLQEFIDGIKIRNSKVGDEMFGMSLKELMKYTEKLVKNIEL